MVWRVYVVEGVDAVISVLDSIIVEMVCLV